MQSNIEPVSWPIQRQKGTPIGTGIKLFIKNLHAIALVLAILLLITFITAGIFYKQLYDMKNELKKYMEQTSQRLEEKQKSIGLQKKKTLESAALQEGSIKELKKDIFLLKEKFKGEVKKSQTLEDEKKQYNQEMNRLTSIISNLETQLDQIRGTHSKDLEKIDQLEKQIKSSTEKVKALKLEVNVFKRELATKEEEQKKLTQMLRIKQEEVSQRLDIINTLEQAGMKNTESLIARQGVIGNLQNDLSSRKEEINKLTSKISNLETELEQLENTHSKDLEKIDQLEKQIKSSTEKVKVLNQEVNFFKRELATKEEEQTELTQMLRIKQEEVSQRLGIINTLEQAGMKNTELLKTRQGVIGNLQNDLSSRKEESNKLTSKISNLETELEQLGNTHSKDLEKISKLEDTNKKAMQSLDVGNERIQSLQMEVDLKSEQVEIMANEMETKLSMTKSEIAELKSKVTEGMMIKEKAILLEKEKTEALMQARTLKETYDKLVEKLKHELDSKEATLKGFERKLTITLIDRILFDFGRASLNQEGKTTLDKVGQALKDSPGTKLRIIGHTDDVPIAEGFRYKFPSNWELSAARASAVARFFHEKNGIEPKKMEVVGKSFYHPLSDNTTQEGRSKNRRVEIAIIPE